jgi:hypothetical protein
VRGGGGVFLPLCFSAMAQWWTGGERAGGRLEAVLGQDGNLPAGPLAEAKMPAYQGLSCNTTHQLGLVQFAKIFGFDYGSTFVFI